MGMVVCASYPTSYIPLTLLLCPAFSFSTFLVPRSEWWEDLSMTPVTETLLVSFVKLGKYAC